MILLSSQGWEPPVQASTSLSRGRNWGWESSLPRLTGSRTRTREGTLTHLLNEQRKIDPLLEAPLSAETSYPNPSSLLPPHIFLLFSSEARQAGILILLLWPPILNAQGLIKGKHPIQILSHSPRTSKSNGAAVVPWPVGINRCPRAGVQEYVRAKVHMLLDVHWRRSLSRGSSCIWALSHLQWEHLHVCT